MRLFRIFNSKNLTSLFVFIKFAEYLQNCAARHKTAKLANKKISKISTLGSRITAIVSVTLVLLLLGMMMVGGIAAGEASSTLRSEVAVIVKLDLNTTDQEVARFKRYVDEVPWAAASMYTSPEDVLAQEMEHNADIMELLDENPYSGEFEIKLTPAYACSDSIAKVCRLVESLEYVDHAVAPAEIADGISRVVSRGQIALGCAAAALLLISVVLIYNTVSLSVYSRRMVIQSMKLVGATPSFIRGPFVRSGIASGLIAATCASAVICGLRLWAHAPAAEMGIATLELAMPWTVIAAICGILYIAGAGICGFSSLFAANRYISATLDDYYK